MGKRNTCLGVTFAGVVGSISIKYLCLTPTFILARTILFFVVGNDQAQEFLWCFFVVGDGYYCCSINYLCLSPTFIPAKTMRSVLQVRGNPFNHCTNYPTSIPSR